MNENDRTTLEQAIYEEMELTPEMIRSIRTLCGVCLCSFVESKAFKIAIDPCLDNSPVLFNDFLMDWLKMMKSRVAITTYANYEIVITRRR